MISPEKKKIKFPLTSGHTEVQKSRDEIQDTKVLKAKGKFMLRSVSETHHSISPDRCVQYLSDLQNGRV